MWAISYSTSFDVVKHCTGHIELRVEWRFGDACRGQFRPLRSDNSGARVHSVAAGSVKRNSSSSSLPGIPLSGKPLLE